MRSLTRFALQIASKKATFLDSAGRPISMNGCHSVNTANTPLTGCGRFHIKYTFHKGTYLGMLSDGYGLKWFQDARNGRPVYHYGLPSEPMIYTGLKIFQELTHRYGS